MRYLCLIYHDEAMIDGLPADEHAALIHDVLDYREALRQGGHDVDATLVQPAESATTIRVRHGRVQIADGPAAGTREQLGGYYLIDARDLNEAIRLAARMPTARLGSIEVRPVRTIEAPSQEARP
jgi:hypothetical protein